MTYLERTVKALKQRIEFIDKQLPADASTKRSNEYQRNAYLCAIGAIGLDQISEEELERAAIMDYSIDMFAAGKGFKSHAKWFQERYLTKAAVLIAASKGLA
jgi:hypothetical protein